VCESSIGNGPVDAAYEAIDKLVGVPNELVEFSIQAVTEGMDAMARVTVRIRDTAPNGNGKSQTVFMGRGSDTDTVVAATRAYLFALNRLIAARQVRGEKQVMTTEVQESIKEMHAQYGSEQEGKFAGWGASRNKGE
jgi:2-isopropylmalate synthase